MLGTTFAFRHRMVRCSGPFRTVSPLRLGSFHLPIGFEPTINQRDDVIKSRMPHAHLFGYKLNEFVRALDVDGTIFRSLSRCRSVRL